MDGSAVTTTSASRITMKDAAEVSSRVSGPEEPRPGCCPVPGSAVPGWVPRSGAVIGRFLSSGRPRAGLHLFVERGRARMDTQFEPGTREPRSRPAAETASMICRRVLVGLDDQVIPEPA